MPLPTTLELGVFQGPLDLLLSLIERRQLDITEVSLATVADQYLQEVRRLPEADPDVLAEFLVIAARLLLLKSRALLPRAAAAAEDEPLDDLAERLEAYRQLRDRALELAALIDQGGQSYVHPPRPGLAVHQPPLAPIEAGELARLWRAILRRQPAPPAEAEAPVRRVSVAERLDALRQALAGRSRLRWAEVAGRTLDETIATFLAVLELVRRSELQVRQAGPFGEISLFRAEPAAEATREPACSEES